MFQNDFERCLETDLYCELQLPFGYRRRKDTAERGRRKVVDWGGEIWMVEEVETLGAELEVLCFRELEVLDEGEVDLLDTIGKNKVSRRRAESDSQGHLLET